MMQINKRFYKKLLLSILILGGLVPFKGFAEVVQEKQSIFDLLHYKEILEVTLVMDMEAVLDDRRDEESHPAIFTFLDVLGNTRSWNAKVELRGKFRRTKCAEMPPLKLNFKKGDLKDAGLTLFDDMKLVTHCVDDDRLAKELLLKEYLAYRLYNQITEESFRVQFLEITYKDSQSKSEKIQWGFLIEDTAQMTARLGGEKWENPLAIDSTFLDKEQVQRVALFQYMIGNADWSIRSARNVKIVKRDGIALVIPYDFDFSAFVGAPYRLIDDETAKHGTTGEHQRYLASIHNTKNIGPVWTEFKSQKGQFVQLIKACKLLKASTKRECIQYIQSFFDNTNDLSAFVGKRPDKSAWPNP